MLANLGESTSLERLVKAGKGDLCVMICWLLRSSDDFHLIAILAHDLCYVECHCALDALSERSGPHFPCLGKPASSTLHAHPKFRQSTLIDWELGCSKCARVVVFMNPGGVVADD